MKSRTSLFNPTIFWNFLRRYWLMWVFYFGLLFFSIVVPLLSSLQEFARNSDIFSAAQCGGLRLLESLANIPLVLTMLGCGAVAAISFSYLYNARHTGLMNSLPVRRETLFCSVLLADLTGLVAADLAVFLICLVLEAVFGAVQWYALGVLLLVLVLESLVFLGPAVFCCMLTGNVFAGPAVYLIFNFTGPAVEYMGRYLLSKLQFGSSGPNISFTEWLSPPLMLLSRVRSVVTADGLITAGDYQMVGLGVLGAYAAVGTVFAGLALLLYRKRRMETAGDIVAIEGLKPVFKVCASLAGALGLASFLTDTLYYVDTSGIKGLATLCLLMVIGGIIGWFIAQMLVEKSIRVFDHGWKGIGAMSLVFVVFLCAGEFDWFGYERNIPDPAEVKSVYFSAPGAATTTVELPESIQAVTALHQSIVDNKDVHELVAKNEGERKYLGLNYELKNGRSLYRNYPVDAGAEAYLDRDSDLWKLEAASNTPEAIQNRYVLDFPITAANVNTCEISYMDAETLEWADYYDLSPADVEVLYNECILPDIQDGNLGYLNVVENDAYAESKYQCNIRLEFRWPVGDKPDISDGKTYRANYDGQEFYYSYFTVYLSKSAERTVAFLNDHGIFPCSVQEAARAQGAEYTPTGYAYADETEKGVLYYDGVDAEFTHPLG